MRETAKNYEARIENGDFKNYLHGDGIDIGGGDDCLQLPPDVEGTVRLWDIKDGDAQYMHKLKDDTFDFVYSSHCLEHMRDIDRAFTNWLRLCKSGGVLYICVPHETWYEKGIWPSVNNHDHKHSFTAYEKSDMPENVVVKDFLDRFSDWIDVIDIRENLMNYRFDWPKEIDQTINFEDRICAQIDFIVRKKDMTLSEQWRKENDRKWLRDYWMVIFPIRTKSFLRTHLPKPLKTVLKRMKNALIH